jgi:actin-like ATPase involved in cell morphogenesis
MDDGIVLGGRWEVKEKETTVVVMIGVGQTETVWIGIMGTGAR